MLRTAIRVATTVAVLAVAIGDCNADGGAAKAGASAGPQPTKVFNFELPVEGGNASSGRLQGLRGTPLVVVFFSTWARPAILQVRDLKLAQSGLRKLGVKTVGLTSADAEEISQFAEKEEPGFVVYSLAEAQIQRLGVQVLPTLWFVDATGTIVGRSAGRVAVDLVLKEASRIGGLQ